MQSYRKTSNTPNAPLSIHGQLVEMIGTLRPTSLAAEVLECASSLRRHGLALQTNARDQDSLCYRIPSIFLRPQGIFAIQTIWPVKCAAKAPGTQCECPAKMQGSILLLLLLL